ncbi:hypothetical protein CBM2592_A110068 [Cupriavidus taiwanensis]|nr:hypothetical protein CBM2592_A110068 [Cupriavidus taiwanensis]SOY80106.1 hypothetical protein CBM2591_A120069 [Cupriavidus taiwanensis]
MRLLDGCSDVLVRDLDSPQDVRRMRPQHFSRCGRDHAARGPFEQVRAELLLQILHLQAQRRLGDVQALGGSGNGASCTNRDESPQGT